MYHLLIFDFSTMSYKALKLFTLFWDTLYIDNLIVSNNKKRFTGHRPSDLDAEKVNRSDNQPNYLGLALIIGDYHRLYTKLYDKHGDFNFDICQLSIPVK